MQFYWEVSPVELHHALSDFKDTSTIGYKTICQSLRNVAVVIHNSAFGRAEKDQINDPKRIWKFPWEKDEGIKIQTVDEMKTFIQGLSHRKGVKVTAKKGDTDG